MCAGDFYGRIEQRKFTGLITRRSRVRIPLLLLGNEFLWQDRTAEVRRTHNPEVGGSNPSPATWQWYRYDIGSLISKGDA